MLARLRAARADVLALPLTRLTDDDLLGVLRELETDARRSVVADHALIAQLESRGTAHEHACRSTAVLLSHALRISPTEAIGRVLAAASMGPRLGLTGEPLAPQFEAVATAQACGAISPAHARIITDSVQALPAVVQAEHHESVQEFLVEQAHVLNPRQLAQVAHRLRDTLDPDGTLADERDRHRRRDLRIRRRSDGSAHVEGELTALCAEALLTTLESLAKPVPAEDGAKHPRTAGQRLHDALHDAMLMALRCGQLPDCGEFAATILLTMSHDHFLSGAGLVTTGHGAHISVTEAMNLFGDARVMPVVLGKTREITAYGSTHRIFTEGARLAMIARDQGCSFPGCTAPPVLCQSHHVTDYALTRRTSVDDGTLLCGFHHREHPKLGWSCRMIDGVPHWIAPRWIDPTQTPRTNRAHHLLTV
ncbi:MAG TPA: DUF222 domain-containing protein [Jatrophihabitantaceae bacterium]